MSPTFYHTDVHILEFSKNNKNAYRCIIPGPQFRTRVYISISRDSRLNFLNLHCKLDGRREYLFCLFILLVSKLHFLISRNEPIIFHLRYFRAI